jgi:hypothetical protein
MFIIVSTLVKQHVSPVEQEVPVVEHLAYHWGANNKQVSGHVYVYWSVDFAFLRFFDLIFSLFRLVLFFFINFISYFLVCYWTDVVVIVL